VSNGGLETTCAAEPSSIRARMLVCHGALDPHLPMLQVTAFAEEMKNAGADYQLIVYGNAMHGFTHETATGQQPGVLYHAQTDRGHRARSRSSSGSYLTGRPAFRRAFIGQFRYARGAPPCSSRKLARSQVYRRSLRQT